MCSYVVYLHILGQFLFSQNSLFLVGLSELLSGLDVRPEDSNEKHSRAQVAAWNGLYGLEGFMQAGCNCAKRRGDPSEPRGRWAVVVIADGWDGGGDEGGECSAGGADLRRVARHLAQS